MSLPSIQSDPQLDTANQKSRHSKNWYSIAIPKLIKKQRRRLSVAPKEVGNVEEEQTGRKHSLVSEKHVEQEPPSFVTVTKKGYVPYNTGKVNQDTFFCDLKFDERNNCRLFGVCDGHGKHGHLVSELVARQLPILLKECDYLQRPKQAMITAVENITEALKRIHDVIDTSMSGTTLVFSLIIADMCYTANVGDSRAIMVSKSAENSEENIAKALSVDHKCELSEEQARIIASGGEVRTLTALQGEYAGPLRVWIPGKRIPGLAMSRSLGDDIAHLVGVSSVPQITEHKISKETDLFLCWASDGLWEFVSNEEVGKVILNQGTENLKQSALMLAKESAERWMAEEECIDDITIVIYAVSDKVIPKEEKDIYPPLTTDELQNMFQKIDKEKKESCVIL